MELIVLNTIIYFILGGINKEFNRTIEAIEGLERSN